MVNYYEDHKYTFNLHTRLYQSHSQCNSQNEIQFSKNPNLLSRSV